MPEEPEEEEEVELTPDELEEIFEEEEPLPDPLPFD